MKRTTKFVTVLLAYSRRSRIFVWIIFLWGIAACETVVEVDIPRESSKLVVNSVIGTDQSVLAQVSLSKSALDNSNLSYVKGAEVVLLEEGTVVATLEEDANSAGNGLYTSPFLPMAGKNYTLQVSKSGYEPVEASTHIPSPIPIQGVSYDTTIYTSSYQNGDSVTVSRVVDIDEIRLTFNDPPGEKNYYEITALQYYTEYVYQYDEEGYVLYDSSYNPIVIDSLPRFSNLYLSSDDPVLSGGDDFLEGSSSFYGDSFTFSDDFINGKSYTFQFQPDGGYFNSQPDENRYVIVLRTINEEQYLYFSSVELQNETSGNPFAEPAQVYNNIENGFGIFVGYSSDQVTFDFE